MSKKSLIFFLFKRDGEVSSCQDALIITFREEFDLLECLSSEKNITGKCVVLNGDWMVS